MLGIQELQWSYGEKEVLHRLSFEVQQGEILGLLGENGSGKTTLLRCIAGILEPQSGSIQFQGKDSVLQAKGYRSLVSYLPEGAPHYPKRRVGEYLQSRRALLGTSSQGLESLLERTGLKDVQGEPLEKLSRGYRQRVALTSSLMADRPLLLLDEPFSGLDPSQVADLRDLIRETAQGGATVLFSSHILPQVYQLCDPIILMGQGDVIGRYTREDLNSMEHLEELFLRSAHG